MVEPELTQSRLSIYQIQDLRFQKNFRFLQQEGKLDLKAFGRSIFLQARMRDILFFVLPGAGKANPQSDHHEHGFEIFQRPHSGQSPKLQECSARSGLHRPDRVLRQSSKYWPYMVGSNPNHPLRLYAKLRIYLLVAADLAIRRAEDRFLPP